MPLSSNLVPKWRARLRLAPYWCQQLMRTAAAPKTTRYACTGLMLARADTLSIVLGERPVFYSRLLVLKGQTIFGWGRKWSGKRAAALALASGKEMCLVEDGFLRSVGRYDPALSLVLDNAGIYYDATTPSEIEALVAEKLSDRQTARALSLTATWRAERLSKYNSARDYSGSTPERYVLVCDQTYGDASIAHGMADAASFSRMMEAALGENPEHQIILKTHPDVVTGGKKGYLDLTALCQNSRIRIVADPVHPCRLLEHADAVYTVTSQLGFEALIWGRRTRCFGMPFYAGWGLTEDELPAPDRRQPVSLEQLVHAALVKYPRYIDPVAMQTCEPERAFAHVGLQRRKRLEFPEKIVAVGFSRWKRPFIEKFLQGSDVSYVKDASSGPRLTEAKAVAVWGSADAPTASGQKTLRVEDGFLRSSGLGADLVRPLSIVFDDVGIYYDATRPSRLERILATEDLDRAAMRRASALRESIIHLDVTKYNLGRRPWKCQVSDRPVLLVVGQVETDASVRLGSPDLKSNMGLLRRVRQDNPSAYIIYKPHPDVLAGLRRSGTGEDACLAVANEVLTEHVSVGQLLGQVDELHTMTSLMGFEALIRGVKVVCHGLPFYAGWGLTEDRVPCARRKKRLTMDELVHGALISYPRYFDYERNCFVDPEHAVQELAKMAANGPQTRTWQRKLVRAGILAWLKLRGSKR